MKKNNSRIRKNIMIDSELELSVKEAASKYDVSESSVIEKALVSFLARDREEELPTFFDYAGAFDCEHRSLSTSYKKITARRK